MKHTPLIVTIVALIVGISLFIAADGIEKQQRMDGKIYETMQLKIAYTPMGEPKLFANVPAESLLLYSPIEGSNILSNQSMVIGYAEAQMMRSEKLFSEVGDSFDSFFGVPITVGGVLHPTNTILDDLHFLGNDPFNSIEGDSHRTYILRTDEGMPKLFYIKNAGELVPLKIRLKEGDASRYAVRVADGKKYYPMMIGSTEAEMMRSEKLFEKPGDRIENFFGSNVFVAGILAPANSSIDMIHIIPSGTIKEIPDYNNYRNSEQLVSESNKKIYVAIEGSGEIASIDMASNKIITKIDLAQVLGDRTVNYMPHNVQVAPNNQQVWVTASAATDASVGEGSDESADGEAIIIDPFSDTIIKRIKLGNDLHLSHVSLTPDSKYAIVLSQEKGIVYKINAVTYEIEKEVLTKEGAEPHGLRISPDGKKAYIAMIGDSSMGILDIENFKLSYVSLKGAAVQTAVTPDGKYALASVYDTKSVAVYDILSSELSYVDLPKEAKGPVQIYPTPDSRYVYVADQGYYFNQPTGDTVYKLDLQGMNTSQAIKSGSAPHGVIVAKDGDIVYVTNLLSGDLSVINAETGKEVTKVAIGDMPNGVSLWYAYG